jgi:asparagine synthase (glutamine-hydrolysing)
MLSEKISKQGYKVVASGTSADEMFTGYYDHHNYHLYAMKDRPDFAKYLENWKENTGKIVRNPILKNPLSIIEQPDNRDYVYLNNEIFAEYLKDDFSEDFYEHDFEADSLLRKRMLNELFHEATPVILQEDDLNSMFYSIENRSPFLDTGLFKFAFSIPVEYLIYDGCAKYLLREAMKGIINDKVRLDRQKRGFNASLNTLVDFEEPETKEAMLSASIVFDIIKRKKIEEAMKQNPLPNSFSKFVFNFINVKMFLEMNS